MFVSHFKPTFASSLVLHSYKKERILELDKTNILWVTHTYSCYKTIKITLGWLIREFLIKASYKRASKKWESMEKLCHILVCGTAHVKVNKQGIEEYKGPATAKTYVHKRKWN